MDALSECWQFSSVDHAVSGGTKRWNDFRFRSKPGPGIVSVGPRPNRFCST